MNEALIEAVAKAIGSVAGDDQKDWRLWEEEARAALAAIEASGTHVVVPVHANADMVFAAEELGETMNGGTWPSHPSLAYEATLAARPKVTP